MPAVDIHAEGRKMLPTTAQLSGVIASAGDPVELAVARWLLSLATDEELSQSSERRSISPCGYSPDRTSVFDSVRP